MRLIGIEHSKLAYGADFAAYGAAVLLLAGLLLLGAPAAQGWTLAGAVLLGLLLWSLAEYALHRFVLHGVQPFERWHAQHHARPTALISAPTALSAGLIFSLVFLPALALAGLWPATALTLGLTVGYQAYAITHHAVHHWRAAGPWLQRRKRWHALHHQAHLQAHHPAQDTAHHDAQDNSHDKGLDTPPDTAARLAPSQSQGPKSTPPGCFGVTSMGWDRVFGSGHTRPLRYRFQQH